VTDAVPGDAAAMRLHARPDPRVRLFLSLLRRSGWPSLAERTPRQARADFRVLAAATATRPLVDSVRDAWADGSVRDIPVRVYRPRRRAAGPRPLVVYFHGGGFVVGDLFTVDGICRRLANGSGATVVSVYYRRPPEHPLPAAHHDAVAATRWALAHAAELGADPHRLVVAGDSAGGALAAHVAQQLRDHGPHPAALQVLFHPATDLTLEQTDRDPTLAQFLDWEAIDWFGAHSLPPEVDRRDPLISPFLAADLSGLPPAHVVTAGIDAFRSDGIAYCVALRRGGGTAEHRDFPGQIHGFVGMDLLFPAGRVAVREAAVRIAAVQPVPPHGEPQVPPAGSIRWARGWAHRRRQIRDAAQLLPPVNGTALMSTLLERRLRSTAARWGAAARLPRGGVR